MPENEIIAEIHRHREELARACGYDLKKLMEYYRHREAQQNAIEHKLVSCVPATPPGESGLVLHEEPSEQKTDANEKRPCPPRGTA